MLCLCSKIHGRFRMEMYLSISVYEYFVSFNGTVVKEYCRFFTMNRAFFLHGGGSYGEFVLKCWDVTLLLLVTSDLE